MDGWMDQWMDGCMGGWWVEGLVGVQMMGGRMDGWMSVAR